MTEREKMLAGELYDCGDPKLLSRWHEAKDLILLYNATKSQDMEEKNRILERLLGGRGENLWITPPFYVDYGNNIYFGNNCEVNMNCTFCLFAWCFGIAGIWMSFPVVELATALLGLCVLRRRRPAGSPDGLYD